MAQEYWKTKLTELDTELCQAIQLLTKRQCLWARVAFVINDKH
jgi:hypothetical protein